MVWRCACGLDIIIALILLCELCHFLTSDSMKVYRQCVPFECSSSYNFIPIFLKLCTCFLHGLEICMWFGYNPWNNFCHFFHFVNFVIFQPQILWKCIDSGYFLSATPYTVACLSLCIFAHLFFHGLKMCMWFGFNPAVNFCHFSTLLTLSFFSFSQVQHQLHQSLIYIFLIKFKLIYVHFFDCYMAHCLFCRLTATYEVSSEGMTSQIGIYTDYLDFCRKQTLPQALPAHKFLQTVRSVSNLTTMKLGIYILHSNQLPFEIWKSNISEFGKDLSRVEAPVSSDGIVALDVYTAENEFLDITTNWIKEGLLVTTNEPRQANLCLRAFRHDKF